MHNSALQGYILGREQHGLMRWILLQIMPQVQDHLTCWPAVQRATTVPWMPALIPRNSLKQHGQSTKKTLYLKDRYNIAGVPWRSSKNDTITQDRITESRTISWNLTESSICLTLLPRLSKCDTETILDPVIVWSGKSAMIEIWP